MQNYDTMLRFWLRVQFTPQCWIWTGPLYRNGYGVHAQRRLSRYAHRAAWQIAFGAIPDSLYVCHHCDNRACVRPSHLFVGTARDNTADMMAKGRLRVWTPARYAHIAKLTPAAVWDIRTRRAAGEPQKVLAAEYGVDQSTISHIHRRHHWRHVP